MMKDKNEPAFPRPYSEDTSGGSCRDGDVPESAQSGLSIRDYFAAKAMQGMLAADIAAKVNEDLPAWNVPTEVCSIAYEIADAMLLARQPQEKGQ